MNPPLVSVLMPAYNAENYIGNAIESVLKQTYHNLELIVVNDGSTDKTEEVLGAIHDNRLKVVHQNNQGQCTACNRAYAESSGTYIKFFDADDLLSSNCIELQLQRLNGSEDKVASAEWGRFYNNDLSTFKLNPESVWKDMSPIDWLVDSLQQGVNMMQCGLWLIPRAVLEKSGLWDERLSLNNDFDFFIRVLLNSEQVIFTPEAKLYYRSGNANTLSGILNRDALEKAILSNKLGVEHLLKFENSLRVRKICANVLQQWAYQAYPQFPDLSTQLEDWIKRLGGSNVPLSGGEMRRALATIVGWKNAKKVHAIYEKIRYN